MKDLNKIGETEKNIRRLFDKLPNLKKVLETLDENEIKYGIFAGTCVYLLASGREPSDIDILVADEDFGKLSGLFKGRVEKRKDQKINCDLFYLDEDHNLEFVSKLNFICGGKNYPFRLTPLAWDNTYKFQVDRIKVLLLNPIDTILEKAIEPRGEDEGKHDLDDINVLVKNIDIDNGYLLKRAGEMKAKKQVAGVLKKFNLI